MHCVPPNLDFSQAARDKPFCLLLEESSPELCPVSPFTLPCVKGMAPVCLELLTWFSINSGIFIYWSRMLCMLLWPVSPPCPAPSHPKPVLNRLNVPCAQQHTLWLSERLLSWNYWCLAQNSSFDFGRTSGSEKAGWVWGLGLEFETQQIIQF